MFMHVRAATVTWNYTWQRSLVLAARTQSLCCDHKDYIFVLLWDKLLIHVCLTFMHKVVECWICSLCQNIVTASTCETCPIRYWPTENTFLHTRILLDENERLSGVHFYETEMAGQSKLPIKYISWFYGNKKMHFKIIHPTSDTTIQV